MPHYVHIIEKEREKKRKKEEEKEEGKLNERRKEERETKSTNKKNKSKKNKSKKNVFHSPSVCGQISDLFTQFDKETWPSMEVWKKVYRKEGKGHQEEEKVERSLNLLDRDFQSSHTHFFLSSCNALLEDYRQEHANGGYIFASPSKESCQKYRESLFTLMEVWICDHPYFNQEEEIKSDPSIP